MRLACRASHAPGLLLAVGRMATSAKRQREGDSEEPPASFLWAGEERRPPIVGRRMRQRATLPAVGDLVTCRIKKISPRLANVDILCVGSAALGEACAGLIRREDVNSPSAREPMEMHCAFRPGDILIAKVVSLGDARAYYLSSADVELGVVLARSSEGGIMKPISFCEMECPISKTREMRKVAKPSGHSPGMGNVTLKGDGGHHVQHDEDKSEK